MVAEKRLKSQCTNHVGIRIVKFLQFDYVIVHTTCTSNMAAS